jgi:multidrug efflux pump subunit AcrA (membrane-fusion protein)
MKSLKLLAVAALAAGSVWLAGCGSHGGHEKAHNSAPEVAVAVAPVTMAPGEGGAHSPYSGVAEEVTLTARTQGTLTRLPKDEGESFRYGEPLALFETEINRAALEAAREHLEAARIRLETAERQRDRMERLKQNRVASERELEIALSEYEAAQAAHAAANAEYRRLLDSVTLTAPFDGVVVLHRVDPGTIVSPGQPILHIRSVARSRSSYAPGDENSLWVPRAALIHRGGLTGVFVVEEDHAVLCWIRTGRTSGESMEVLSGVDEGEAVVLEPGQLIDGQPVRVER